jgi:hypothetical protein
MIADSLAAAFKATTYRVETGAGRFDLRIGAVNPAFDDFLRGLGACRWGLLTAHNPGGVRVRCDDENSRSQGRLLQRVQGLGWTSLAAVNVADDGVWPDEPGVLVLQVGEQELRAVAAEFFQRAFVCSEVGSAARLVWL